MIVVKIQMRKPSILSCRHGFHVFQQETEYSYPFYFYTGNEKCHAKNIVTGINGITVISDKPCFYYVCASDIGYGKDITAWERKGARSGYGVSTIGNVDTSLVQPGEYYVVIARFADNTYLMTDVMCKTE